MAKILKTLIDCSNRAAAISKACCSETAKETLFVAEKGVREANLRFDKDFKTIADVLVQETVKAVIATRFPDLAVHVRGEECAEIGGVCIKILDSPGETSDLLSSLIPKSVSNILAEAAHGLRDTEVSINLPSDLPEISTNDLGIWIDPIDATAEFIAGVHGETKEGCGLQCVTVLIGAYKRSTGEPVIGVIHQPFYNNEGRILWGINFNGMKRWGGHDADIEQNKIILMSNAEKPDVAERFKSLGWEVQSAPGAGHKLLKVIIGEAVAYILSKSTTFRWDTCAAHAILLAQGGDVVSYSDLCPITYNDPEDTDVQHLCNAGGIIAFRNKYILDEIKEIITQ